MAKKKCSDGRRNNRPPKEHQFKPNTSGNLKGRPKKKKSTMADEIQEVFGRSRKVTIDGIKKHRSMRQLILEQIALGAAKGDPKMIKLAMPIIKTMDDAPEFEIRPGDRQIINDFKKRFTEEGDQTDEE